MSLPYQELHPLLLASEQLHRGRCVLSTLLKGSSRAAVEEWQSVTHAFSMSRFPASLGIRSSDLAHANLLLLPLGFHYFLFLPFSSPFLLSRSLSLTVCLSFSIQAQVLEPILASILGESKILSDSFSSFFSFSFFFTLHLGRHSIN